MTTELAAAYSATGAAWQRGAGPIYDLLSEILCEAAPVPLAGAVVLDLGAGTGAASRAARRRGAGVVAVDVAHGMLAAIGAPRPPCAVADALALPFPAAVFDAVIAAFSLNHVADAIAALREATRVLRPGGGVVVSAYATDDRHPARDAVEAAARDRGWVMDPWYEVLRCEIAPRLATVERAEAVATAAGITAVDIAHLRVPVPGLSPQDLVAWRLGMAYVAPFVVALPERERAAMVADAVARLGPEPPELVRSIIVLTGRAVSAQEPVGEAARRSAVG